MKIIFDAPIPNTFGFSVKAACFAEYASVEELIELLRDDSLPRPFFHIGGGSNLLFTRDFPGTILHSGICFTEIAGDGVVRVGAGVVWDELCENLATEGLWGTENLSLIPGEAGAAAVQNIGAYGIEAGDLITEVECLDTETLELAVIPAEQCQYGYRASRFKGEWKGRYIVSAVRLQLSPDYSPRLTYGHVGDAVEARFGTLEDLTPMMLRETVIDIRHGKLPEPSEVGSAGSFFRNPFVSDECYAAVEAVAACDNLGPVPHFASPEGIKIPAAWLIEKCGWKGFCDGNVGVWKHQPLVLVNLTGKASPSEIISLEERIVSSVRDRFGIILSPEVEHV